MSAPPALWRQTQNKFKRNIFKNRFDTFVYMSDSHQLFLNPFFKLMKMNNGTFIDICFSDYKRTENESLLFRLHLNSARTQIRPAILVTKSRKDTKVSFIELHFQSASRVPERFLYIQMSYSQNRSSWM